MSPAVEAAWGSGTGCAEPSGQLVLGLFAPAPEVVAVPAAGEAHVPEAATPVAPVTACAEGRNPAPASAAEQLAQLLGSLLKVPAAATQTAGGGPRSPRLSPRAPAAAPPSAPRPAVRRLASGARGGWLARWSAESG